jgi:hypothetical protein
LVLEDEQNNSQKVIKLVEINHRGRQVKKRWASVRAAGKDGNRPTSATGTAGLTIATEPKAGWPLLSSIVWNPRLTWSKNS